MSSYNRPYSKDFYKSSVKQGRYPYSDDLLKRYDIFPLLVLDGGAFFSTNHRLGGATARHFLDALDDGTLLADWLVDGRMVWDKVYDQTIGSPCCTLIEQHVWANRLYFLLPIAQRYMRSGEERWAKLWFKYFDDWCKANPYIDMALPDARVKTKYTWFDMQITWRLLVMIHSVKLLAGSTSLKRNHWRKIYQAIGLHSGRLYEEALNALKKKSGHGNHFLQHGVALMYTGALYPELENAEGFIEAGREIVKDQLTKEIFKDGGSIEGSPSYSHFIARLYVDAYLLLKMNGLKPIAGLERGIKKQYKHLEATATPQGKTMQVSDSYALDVEQDLRIVRELMPIPQTKTNKSVCFADSQIVVLRKGDVNVYIDAMPNKSHHIHAGKPNVLVFVGDEQVLMDSGCSSYDLELWEDWYRSAQSHNVLLVSPANARGFDPKYLSDTDILIRKYALNKVVIESKGGADGFRYVWRRSVSITDKSVTIVDQVDANKAARVEQPLHLAPANAVVERGGKRAVLQLARGDVVIEQVGGETGSGFTPSQTPAIGSDNRVCLANRLSRRGKGKRVTMKVRLRLHGL